MNEGNYEAAVRDYDRAIGLKPDRAALFNDRGVALEKVGEIHRAEEDYGRALELDPAVAAVRVNRGRVRYLLGRPAEAASDLEAALRAAPPNWPHRAEVEKALEELRRVIK